MCNICQGSALCLVHAEVVVQHLLAVHMLTDMSAVQLQCGAFLQEPGLAVCLLRSCWGASRACILMPLAAYLCLVVAVPPEAACRVCNEVVDVALCTHKQSNRQ
jgi:hypothetical protein